MSDLRLSGLRHAGRHSRPGLRRRDRDRAGRPGRRPDLEPLEERTLMSLLGLAQEGVKPDIASGVRSNLSYTQAGNNTNPFHYDAVPVSLAMPNGSVARITHPANATTAQTRLDLTLTNAGAFAGGVAGPDYSVTGHVTVNATAYDGTLLTAEAQDFGFSNTITPSSGEFEARLVVTGGLLTQAGGPYHVGDSLGLLLHQPGLTINSFPATFSVSASSSGSSDTKDVPPPTDRPGSRDPLPPPSRDPTTGGCVPPTPTPDSPASGCSCDCGCSTSTTSTTSSMSTTSDCPDTQSSADGQMAPYDGTARQSWSPAEVPGLGLDWSLSLTFRGDLSYDGPLGNGWEMNDDRRVEVVTASNLAKFQAAFPSAKVGDVDQIDGAGRDDLYVLNNDGSYTAPAGYYSTLVKNGDGSYSESESDGTVIRYNPAGADGIGTMASMADRDGHTMRFTYNAQEELTFVSDTLGRPFQYFYDPSGRLTEVRDFMNRSTRFGYDANDNLTSVTTPSVTGTPTGNDFPNGMTTRYTYDASHRLTSVTAPDEVASGGPPRLVYSYDAQGRVTSLQEGGTNASGVGAGGTFTYSYQTLASPTPGDTVTPARQTTVTDRDGNVSVYQYNQLNNLIDVKQETNRSVRSGDPAFYETRYAYDTNYRLTQQVNPQGNTVTYTYDTANPNRYQQGDLLSTTVTPDAARGGDQSAITTTYTYEPIYNQLHTVTEARGNDPSYVPQNGGAGSPARYTTTYTYDYQEGTNFAALGAALGISASAAQARLSAAGIPMGLGDVNGDGRTDQTDGELIRTQSPTVTLLPGSNEAAVEGTTSQPVVTTYAYNDFGQLTRTTDPEGNVTTYTYYSQQDPNGDGVIDDPGGNPTTGGYLRQMTQDAVGSPGRDSGTNPAPSQITTTYGYDAIGNLTRETDGRGVTTLHVYDALNRLVETITADAHTAPPSGPAEPLPLTDFQYQERFFYDFNGNVVLHEVEDRGNTSNVDGSPPAADLPSYIVNPDPAGGTAYIDTVTKYDILGQPIETVQEVGGGEFLHTRYRYDPNGNLTLTIHPEGNADTSAYDERGLLYRSVQGATDPGNRLAGGTSSGGNTSTTLNDTTQSWAANQWAGRTLLITAGTGAGQVRTVTGNTATRLTVGTPWGVTPDATSQYTITPTLLGPNDPINYDVRGGLPGTTTYRYDLNGNLTEAVDGDDTDLSPGNNDPTLGAGDRTRYLYDGFDRRTSVVDAVGDQTVYQYDPAGNIVRTTHFGPVGGPSPTSDGPAVLPGPVSSGGTIQAGNLVSGNLLSAAETSYDELGRVIQTGDVLFVNTIPTARAPDVAEGGSGVGLGDLTPGQTQPIPGVSGVTILGRVSTRTEYDRDSRTTFTVLDDGRTSRTFYDGANREIKAVDPAGNTVETAYDADGNVIETRETDVSQVPGVASEVFLTTNDYDSLDRLQRTVDNLGETTDYRYDSRNDLVAQSDANASLGSTITRRAFPDGPRTVDTTNGFGNVTLFYYDGLGRMTRQEQVLTASGRGDGAHIGASVDGVKNDPAAPESFPPAADPSQGGGDGLIRTVWNYDANSRLSSVVDDNGNATVYLYDNLGRKVAETGGTTVSLARGTSTGGDTATTLNDTSAAWAVNQWQGRTVRITGGTGAGQVRTIASNTATQLVLSSPWGTVPDATSTYAVAAVLSNATVLGPRVIPTPTAATINNPAVIPAAQIDAQLAEARSRLDAVSSLFPAPTGRVDDHPPTTTVWGDDPDGNVLITQDQNGSETFTKYDAVNRAVAVRVFRAGQHDGFAGDPVFAPSPANPIPTNPSLDDEPTPPVVVGTTAQNFQYDGLSRVVLATDNNDPTTAADDSTVTDAYDSLGRIIEEAQTIGGMPTKVISSAWRAESLRSGLTYPNGRTEVYTYDPLGRLKTVSDQGAAQPIAVYDYIGPGRVLDRSDPQNGTRETYLDDSGTVDIGYDGVRRPVDLRTLRSDNSLVIGFTYVYDRAGNKLDEEKLHDPGNGESYTYDSADRLLSFQRNAGGIAPLQSQWSLDGVGNWSQVDGETRQYSSFNEVTQRSGPGGTTPILSDDNGNETDDGTYLYTYDSLNRLRTVTRKADNAPVAVYTYDARGRRTSKVVTNSGALNGTTDFYLDGPREVEERNGADVLTQQYVFGASVDELLVIDRNLNGDATATGVGDQRLYASQNALLSNYALTDGTGKVVEGYLYDAYGRQTVYTPGPNGAVDFGGDDVVTPGGASAVGNPFLFTGRRLDAETGLIYFRARYEDPVLGRFISRDPAGFQHGNPRVAGAADWGMNLYEYAGGQPVLLVDPSGLAPINVLAVPSDDASLQGERDRVKNGPNGYKYTPYAGIADLISKMKDLTKNGDCVRTLEIDAHGSPNSVDGVTSANAAATGKQLKDDVKFCCPCSIYLAGCNTGLGSGKMAQDMANATGCTVYGSMGYLSGTHAEGNEKVSKECDYNGHHYNAYPGSKDATGNDSWKAFRPCDKPAAPGGAGDSDLPAKGKK